MNRLLFIDTETGGVDPNKHSLLSVGFVLWDKDNGVLLSEEFFVKASQYSVTKTAQKMNHFSIEEHEARAVSPEVIIQRLHEINMIFFDGEGIQLAGHNTQFDVSFIKKLYSSAKRSYEKEFSHRIVDTYSVLRFLCDSGKLEMDYLSSAKAFSKFGIRVNGRHSALGDAEATMNLYLFLLTYDA